MFFCLLLSIGVLQAEELKIENCENAKAKCTEGKLVTSTTANEYLIKNKGKSIFIDIRSTTEVALLGTPKIIDKNIPFMEVDINKWNENKKDILFVKNQDFVDQVQNFIFDKDLNEDTPIFLMCRSGDRSAIATTILKQAGFSNVYSIIDGFEGDKAKEGELKGKRVVNGWKNNNLEWEYLSSPEKISKILKFKQ